MNSRDVNESFSIYPLPPSNLYIESLFCFFFSDSVFHFVLFLFSSIFFFLFLHLFFFFGPFIYFLSMFSPSFLPKFLSTPSFLSIVLFFPKCTSHFYFLLMLLSPILRNLVPIAKPRVKNSIEPCINVYVTVNQKCK